MTSLKQKVQEILDRIEAKDRNRSDAIRRTEELSDKFS